MARLGIILPVIEKVLNHISGSFAGIVGWSISATDLPMKSALLWKLGGGRSIPCQRSASQQRCGAGAGWNRGDQREKGTEPILAAGKAALQMIFDELGAATFQGAFETPARSAELVFILPRVRWG